MAYFKKWPILKKCNFSSWYKGTFRYDYLTINDDGLLTPNSTVNSITADYTREMILSQNRRRLNSNSNDSISSPNPSNSNKVYFLCNFFQKGISLGLSFPSLKAFSKCSEDFIATTVVSFLTQDERISLALICRNLETLSSRKFKNAVKESFPKKI